MFGCEEIIKTVETVSVYELYSSSINTLLRHTLHPGGCRVLPAPKVLSCLAVLLMVLTSDTSAGDFDRKFPRIVLSASTIGRTSSSANEK